MCCPTGRLAADDASMVGWSGGRFRHDLGDGEDYGLGTARHPVTADANEQDRAPEFSIGDMVAVKADPSRKGPVISVLPAVNQQPRYRVFHSSDIEREYGEDQLVASDATPTDPWTDGLTNGAWLDPETFHARLIAARLSNPEDDHLYSLHAARIQFIPFQFKPILRLLRSDRPRLLIADDVGVGKTIEAGLILKELATRQRLDRVLVVCPKALTQKWRAEMRRFDEDFRVLDAGALRYCLDEVGAEGVWPVEYSRSIVHYELARMEAYLLGSGSGGRRHPGFLELDPPPSFDLVIADEAHHLRTRETGSHRLMEFLCGVSEAVVLLSATPVQTSSKDLFVLLSLLRPDLFPDYSTFEQTTEPNRFVTAAARALREGPALGPHWVDEARTQLDLALDTPWGRNALERDPSFMRTRNLVAAGELSDDQRVRSIRDLEEAHSLAHLMNRTRRRDIGRFTIRESVTVSVPFTDPQQDFYRNVLAFRRRVLSEEHPPVVVGLILDTLERQAASSITALAKGIDRLLNANGFPINDLTDDPEWDHNQSEVPEEVALDLQADASDLIRQARALPAEDPKLDRLVALVSETMADRSSPGKVLVFSFFLHTLDYLRECLDAEGIRVEIINGRTADEEREELRSRFRLDRDDPLAIDVLLSSEVGCEGLDYEFCDRLVNYDIPWNPMRLEQRIGRIDRFGQKSEKVQIFSFVTPGTVEERVFHRCYERLGIFSQTVGDLEEILGPMADQLNRIATDRSLTAEQQDLQARQVQDNAIRLAEEQRRFERESGSLLGLDDVFSDDVGSVISQGRFVGSSDLEAMVAQFLRKSSVGGALGSLDGGARKLRLTGAGRDELSRLLREHGTGRSNQAFLASLEAGDEVRLTFEQVVASEQRAIEFITPAHPLAQLAVGYWASAEEPLVGGVRVQSPTARPGKYVFVCELWETIAARPQTRLRCFAIESETGSLDAGVGENLLDLLQSAGPIDRDSLPISEERIGECLHELLSVSESQRSDVISELRGSNDVLIDRRSASLQSYYSHRLDRVRADLEAATEPRIVRMKQAELARIESEFEKRSEALRAARELEILTERVAAGVMEVADDAS